MALLEPSLQTLLRVQVAVNRHERTVCIQVRRVQCHGDGWREITQRNIGLGHASKSDVIASIRISGEYSLRFL